MIFPNMKFRNRIQAIELNPMNDLIRVSCLILVLLGLFAQSLDASLPVKELAKGVAVDFESDILPIFKKNCLACHNTTKARGDLNLETPQLIRDGGSSGDVVIPGDPSDSLLYLSASHAEEDYIMPPEGNKVKAKNFTANELGLLKRWIENGAKGTVSKKSNIQFENLTVPLDPINALALSNDGYEVFWGRGNRLFTFDIENGNEQRELMIANDSSPAHKDLVHSIAVHPNSNLLATGDFREIHIWEKEPIRIHQSLNLTNLGMVSSILPVPDKGYLLGDVYGNLGFRQSNTKSNSTTRLLDSPHQEKILTLTKLNDGKILSISQDGICALWNGENLKLLSKVEVPFSIVSSCQMDAYHFLVGLEDGTIQHIHLFGESLLGNKFRIHSDPIESIEPIFFESKSKTVEIISMSESGIIQSGLLQIDTGKYKSNWTRQDKNWSHCLSPDNSRLALNSHDGSIYIINVKDGKVIQRLVANKSLTSRKLINTNESRFLKSEIAYFKRQVSGKEKTYDEQKKRSEKASTDVKSKKESFQKLTSEFNQKKSELDELKNKLSSLEMSVAQAKQLAESAKAHFEKLKGEIISKNVENTQSKRLGQDVELLANKAFQAGKLDEKFQNLNSSSKPEISGLKKSIQTNQKVFDELVKKEQAEKLQFSLAEEELRLALLGVETALMLLEEEKAKRARTEKQMLEVEKETSEIEDLLNQIQRTVGSMVFSNSGKQLVVSDYNGILSVWNIREGKMVHEVKPESTNQFLLSRVHNGIFCSVSGHQKINEIDIRGEWKYRRTIGSISGESPIQERVHALRFSRDGQLLGVGSGASSRSGQIIIFKTQNYELLKNLQNVHSDVVYGIDFSWDNKFIVSGSADKFVRVVDISSGHTLKNFEGHSHYVMDVSIHRDGRTILSSAADNLVKVWNLDSGQRVKDIRVSSKEVTSVNLIPFSNKFVTSSGDNKVSLYQTDGKKLKDFPGIQNYMTRSDVDQAGRIVIGGGQDGILYIWDLENAKLLHALKTRNGEVSLSQKDNER